jgi:membrane-associated phospholipid phosphatase
VSASGTKLEEADVAIAQTLGRTRHSTAVRTVGTLSEIADQAPALSVCGATLVAGLLFGREDVAEAGARMFASVVLATAIKAISKGLISRARPRVLFDQDRYRFELLGPGGGDWKSFPSGHTADAMAAARGLTRIFPELGGAAYTSAAAIALVQIPRAKHYPIDVTAGAVVGIIAELAVNYAISIAWARERDRLEPIARKLEPPRLSRFRYAIGAELKGSMCP